MNKSRGRLGSWACAFVLLSAAAAHAEQAAQQPVSQPAPGRQTIYHSAVVAADHELASKAGATVLAQGGNAVDAAVATSFALSVVRPDSCGIGGGGFMVIHLEHPPRGGKPLDVCIDFRETCPAAVKPDTFEQLPDGASERGGASVAVPGEVAGLLLALEKYGTLPRDKVMAPAIALARQGCTADAHSVHSAEVLRKKLSRQDEESWPGSTELRRWYLQGVRIGGIISTPEQGAALEIIARDGVKGFSDGPLGTAVVAAVQAHHGYLTLADLAAYTPKETPPLLATLEPDGLFKGRRIVTMPLTSSGGITLIETLRLLEHRPELAHGGDAESAPFLHALGEAFKLAFADRAQYLGDPAFMAADPTGAILDPARLHDRAAMIDPDHVLDPAQCAQSQRVSLPEDHGTSHFSVVDKWGDAVACTETINLEFGSMVAVPAYGFVLNDQMDDFLTRKGRPNAFKLTQSERNLPQPGKRPLSSMTPTIVLDPAGKVEMVCGASGGPRIITATAQTLLNAMLFGMSASQSVDVPRIHHQWMPDLLRLERPAPEARAALEKMGHPLGDMQEPAAVQFILRAGKADGWEAASDPRKGGKPAGE